MAFSSLQLGHPLQAKAPRRLLTVLTTTPAAHVSTAFNKPSAPKDDPGPAQPTPVQRSHPSHQLSTPVPRLVLRTA
jgi:hypothetical protein